MHVYHFSLCSRVYVHFGLVWFGLISLFNDISTSLGYLITNSSLYKKSKGTV